MNNPKVKMALRIILGLILVIFGLNKFLNFMPMPPMTGGAGDFMGALSKSGYMMPFIGAVEVIVGLLLLINKYTALALVILAPVAINMLFFHLFLDIKGIGPAALVTILNIVLLFAYKSRYNGILES